MALLGATFTLESSEQFLAELQDLTTIEREASLDAIDYALRSVVAFAASFYEDFLLDSCSQAVDVLLHSDLWTLHSERHCHSLVSLILAQDQRPAVIAFCLQILDLFGREHHFAHRLMRRPPLAAQQQDSQLKQAVVPFMMDIIQQYDSRSKPQDLVSARLPWLCAEVLYETCRHTRMSASDLSMFTDAFVVRLFELIELSRDDGDEQFNYTLVKLIIALNEQFMVASLNSTSASKVASASDLPPSKPVATAGQESNVVLRTIRDYLGAHKTFGENLIFILNRCTESEEDRCISLLILKILYLLFTSPGTQEYFYTNDLCVLVDIFIRELHDLPDDSEGLRHTFLRVLHPLSTNTQLRLVPYKRAVLHRQLRDMITTSSRNKVHTTTRRLVERNLSASWAKEEEASAVTDPSGSPSIAIESPDAIEQSLQEHAESHRAEVPAARRSSSDSSDPAASALADLRIRTAKAFASDDISRRGSTISMGSVNSASSIAVATHDLSQSPLVAVQSPTDINDEQTPIPRPSSAASSVGSTVKKPKKRKPPPIPGCKHKPPNAPQSGLSPPAEPSPLHLRTDTAEVLPRTKRDPPPIPRAKRTQWPGSHQHVEPLT